MKTYYKLLNKIRLWLCGSCDNGIEWEHDGTSTMCYCNSANWSYLVKFYIKRKRPRKKIM